MEFVDGATLSQVLSRLKEAAPEAETAFGKKDGAGYFEGIARAFADVADGLQHAHSKGVIHRDIKPSSLILDSEGRVRILDFGLARLEGQESLTISGDVVGTPLYMSPEQARRKKIPIDHRTDVYSLGATLYVMLTLRPPFSGKDHNDTLSQIIEREAVEPRKINPRVPKDLETIVLKCLRKDAGDRYGTAEALGQDLKRFIRGDAIEARPLSGLEKLLRRAWRERAKAGVALALVLLTATGGWLFWHRHMEDRLRVEAVYEAKVLGAVLNLELASVNQRGFFDVPVKNLGAVAGHEPVKRALLDLDAAQALFPARPDARYHRARALLFLEEEENALAALRDLSRQHAGFTPASLLESSILEKRGDVAGAKALKEWAEVSGAGGWAEAWLRAHRARREGRFHEAIDAWSLLIESEEAGRKAFIGSTIVARINRGTAYLEVREPIRALLDFTMAKYLAPGSAEPALLEAKAWYVLGKHEEASSIFEKVFVDTSLKTETGLSIADIYRSLGENQTALDWVLRIDPGREQTDKWMWALWDLGRFEDAVEVGKKAIELDSMDARVHANLGWILGVDLSRYEEALPLAKRATDLEPRNAEFRFWLAQLFKNLGKFDDAVAEYQASLDLDTRNAMVRAFLARCYVQMGRSQEALREYARANEISPRHLYVLDQEAAGLIEMGKLDEALPLLDRAVACDSFCSEPRILRGRVFERQGKLEKAAEEYLKGGRYRRRTVDCYLWRERLLERLGRTHEALPGYLEVLELDPKNAPAHWRIARLLRAQQPTGFREEIDRLLEVPEKAPPGAEGDPWFLNSRALAWAMASPGKRDLARAIEVALQGLERAEDSPAVFEELTKTVREVLALSSCNGKQGPQAIPSLPPFPPCLLTGRLTH